MDQSKLVPANPEEQEFLVQIKILRNRLILHKCAASNARACASVVVGFLCGIVGFLSVFGVARAVPNGIR